MLTPADLAAIQARLDAASPGPWEARLDGDAKAAARNWRIIGSPGTRRLVVTEDFYEGRSMGETYTNCGVRISEPDADLIAHAPADLRALLDEVERLRADLATVTAERDALTRYSDELRGLLDREQARCDALRALLAEAREYASKKNGQFGTPASFDLFRRIDAALAGVDE